MKTLAFAAAAAFGLTALTPVVHADDFDNKTTIKVNETILIPGRTLAPGTYVIKLMPSFTNRNIVQIFNEDQSQLQATILAINNYRLQPADKTILQYWETPSGSPPALRAWFSPGDNSGQEFAYPKRMADELARANNNAKVPYYADNAQVGSGPQSFENVAVVNGNSEVDAPRAQAQTQTRVEEIVVPPTPPVNAGNDVLAQQQPGPRPAETLLAQNQPPQPESSNATAPLPQTATSLGWVAAIGLMLLSSAAAFRYMRRV